MFTDEQLKRLLKDMDDLEGKEIYVFVDEQEGEIHSEWLPNDQLALRLAEILRKRSKSTVNVLRYIGAAE